MDIESQEPINGSIVQSDEYLYKRTPITHYSISTQIMSRN
ncbi:hypothetical protein Ct9H90mP29_02580 [bacterium]|nr:MAG: hypothetical protein Ct9H90mP29_02580 [bacterium]